MHRSQTPEATLARVRTFAAAMGITRLGNVTGLDRIGLPVAVAVRPNSWSYSVSQGKGLTPAHAMASALMEATEIFHAEDLSDRIRFSGHNALSRACSTADIMALCRTDVPFNDKEIIGWVEGVDLMAQEPCWVPAEIVDTDARLPRRPGRGFFLSNTNGLASGNHVLEALSAAICELVERDAVALWHARKLGGHRLLDLGSVDDPDSTSVLKTYENAGVSVRVWDATSDIGIPTFICDVWDKYEDPSASLPRCRGAGCHPDRAIALLRSLTEAAQVRLTHITGIRDDIPAGAYRKSPLEELTMALIDAASVAGERVEFRNVPTYYVETVEEDVQWLLKRLCAVGLEQVIAVDLTRPKFGIPVVRVIIPGLEPPCNDELYRPGKRANIAAVG